MIISQFEYKSNGTKIVDGPASLNTDTTSITTRGDDVWPTPIQYNRLITEWTVEVADLTGTATPGQTACTIDDDDSLRSLLLTHRSGVDMAQECSYPTEEMPRC